MSLKNNKPLKYFALLLFTLELLSPVFLYSSVQDYEEGKQINLHSPSHSINPLAFLIGEEASNEEEREGREHRSIFITWELSTLQFYYHPEKFEPTRELTFHSYQESSQPSLIILHRNYRI